MVITVLAALSMGMALGRNTNLLRLTLSASNSLIESNYFAEVDRTPGAEKISFRYSGRSETNSEEKVLWESKIDTPLLTLLSATQLSAPIENGNYQVQYESQVLSNTWEISQIQHELFGAESTKLTVQGNLLRCKYQSNFQRQRSELCSPVAQYSIAFTLQDLKEELLLPSVKFEVSITPLTSLAADSDFHVVLKYSCADDETFSGFGESFAPLNLGGRLIPILVSEQGLGRGLQPLTNDMNTEKGEGVGGHWFTTYAPKPLYLTNYLRTFLLHTSYPSYFDLRETVTQETVSIEIWTTSFSGEFSVQQSVANQVQAITVYTGRQPTLADWTQHGAILGLEGGTDEVTEQVEMMLAGGTAVAGVWLQDWVGRRHSWDGDRLIWNWQLNSQEYPQWNEMIETWNAKKAATDPAIKVLTYLNPFFSDPTNFTDTTQPGFRNFYQEGLENGYFVQHLVPNPDSTELQMETYLQKSLSITFATLDVANPAAVKWMQSIIQQEVLTNSQSFGWMCDFGEYLPFDAYLVDSVTGKPISAAEMHNLYPQKWAELTYEAIAAVSRSEEIMFFTRAGYLQSSRVVPVFWLGDQLQSWDSYDGLGSMILGSLSSGLSGNAVTHSDIGGYNAVLPPDDDNCGNAESYVRNAELLARWAEIGVFSHAIFRTHIGSSMDSRITQVYSSPETIGSFARHSRLFAALAAYRQEVLLPEAQEKGWPLSRPLVFHYPATNVDSIAQLKESPLVWSSYQALFNHTSSFLFGREFLCTATLRPGATVTTVYFPRLWQCAQKTKGESSETWVHLVSFVFDFSFLS